MRDIRRLGSAALDLAWTAAGRYDAYYERGVQEWDVAAGPDALPHGRARDPRAARAAATCPTACSWRPPALIDPLLAIVG